MISLKSQVTIKILNYYFLNPQAKHYVNELARILDLDPKNTHRKLGELEHEGVLRSEFSGKQKYFFLNKKSKIAKTYEALLARTAGLPEQLKQAVGQVRGVEQVYIFGSYAKNTMDAGSDIDLLVVGSHSALELQKTVNKIQKWAGREINTVNISPKELKQKAGSPFVRNIFSHKHIRLL